MEFVDIPEFWEDALIPEKRCTFEKDEDEEEEEDDEDEADGPNLLLAAQGCTELHEWVKHRAASIDATPYTLTKSTPRSTPPEFSFVLPVEDSSRIVTFCGNAVKPSPPSVEQNGTTLKDVRAYLEAQPFFIDTVPPTLDQQFSFCTKSSMNCMPISEEGVSIRSVICRNDINPREQLLEARRVGGYEHRLSDLRDRGVCLRISFSGTTPQQIQRVFDALRCTDFATAEAALNEYASDHPDTLHRAFLFADEETRHTDYTPLLHAAVRSTWVAGVSMLLEWRNANSAKKTDRDGRGRTVFHSFADAQYVLGKSEKLLELLVTHCGPIDIPDLTGRTASVYSLLSRHSEQTKLLINAGASPLHLWDTLPTMPSNTAEERELKKYVASYKLYFDSTRTANMQTIQYVHTADALLGEDNNNTALFSFLRCLYLNADCSSSESVGLLSLLMELGQKGVGLVKELIEGGGGVAKVPSDAVALFVTQAAVCMRPELFAKVFGMQRVRRLCKGAPYIAGSERFHASRATPLHSAVALVCKNMAGTRLDHVDYFENGCQFCSVEYATKNIETMLAAKDCLSSFGAAAISRSVTECRGRNVQCTLRHNNSTFYEQGRDAYYRVATLSPLYFALTLFGREWYNIVTNNTAWTSASDLLDTLLSHSANPNEGLGADAICRIVSDPLIAMRPLAVSVTAGHLNATRILLKHGASPTLQQQAFFQPITRILIPQHCNTLLTEYPPLQDDSTEDLSDISDPDIWRNIARFAGPSAVEILSRRHYRAISSLVGVFENSPNVKRWGKPLGVLTEAMGKFNARREVRGEAPVSLNMRVFAQTSIDLDDEEEDDLVWLAKYIDADMPCCATSECFGGEVLMGTDDAVVFANTFESLSIGHDRYDLGFLDWTGIDHTRNDTSFLQCLHLIADLAPAESLYGVSIRPDDTGLSYPLATVLHLEALRGVGGELSTTLLEKLCVDGTGGIPAGAFGEDVSLSLGCKRRVVEAFKKVVVDIDEASVFGWNLQGTASLQHEVGDCITGRWFAPDRFVKGNTITQTNACKGSLYKRVVAAGNVPMLSTLLSMTRLHEKVEMEGFKQHRYLTFEVEREDEEEEEEEDDDDEEEEEEEEEGDNEEDLYLTSESHSYYDLLCDEPSEITELAVLIMRHGQTQMFSLLKEFSLCLPDHAGHAEWYGLVWTLLMKVAVSHSGDAMLPFLLERVPTKHLTATLLHSLIQRSLTAGRPEQTLILIDHALPILRLCAEEYYQSKGVSFAANTHFFYASCTFDEGDELDHGPEDSLFVRTLRDVRLLTVTERILNITPIPDTVAMPEKPLQPCDNAVYALVRCCAQFNNGEAAKLILERCTERDGTPSSSDMRYYIHDGDGDDEEEEEDEDEDDGESCERLSTDDASKGDGRRGYRTRTCYEEDDVKVVLPASQDAIIHSYESIKTILSCRPKPPPRHEGFASEKAKAHFLQHIPHSNPVRAHLDTLQTVGIDEGSVADRIALLTGASGCSSRTLQACLRAVEKYFRETPPAMILFTKQTGPEQVVSLCETFCLNRSHLSGGRAQYSSVVPPMQVLVAPGGKNDVPTRLKLLFRAKAASKRPRKSVKTTKKRHGFFWRSSFHVVGGFQGAYRASGDVSFPSVMEGGGEVGMTAVYSPAYRAVSRDFRFVSLSAEDISVEEEAAKAARLQGGCRSLSSMPQLDYPRHYQEDAVPEDDTAPMPRPDVHKHPTNQFYTLVVALPSECSPFSF